MGLGRKYKVWNTKIRLVGPLTTVGFKSISLTKISYTTSETKGLHVTEKVEHSKVSLLLKVGSYFGMPPTFVLTSIWKLEFNTM